MAWKILTVKLTGDAPVICHNSRLADPCNKITRKMKEISSKRKKVDADFEALAKLEFYGGLYMGAGGPIIPGVMLEAAIREGAKRTREGRVAQSSVFVPTDSPLIYEGPKTAEGLWADDRFRNVAIVNVQRSRIVRTRPMFPEWSILAGINFEDTLVTQEKVLGWLTTAGLQCGIGDWRPRYGRFTANLNSQLCGEASRGQA